MSFADEKLGASFFCSRYCEDRSNLHTIFPTLASQLAYQYSAFQKELLQVLRADPDAAQQSLCFQMEKLIVGPLEATQIHTLIIIDGIDECKDKKPTSAILSILSCYVDRIPNVKFFISGQCEQLHWRFQLPVPWPTREICEVYEIEVHSVIKDAKLFLRTQLPKIQSQIYLPTLWTQDGWFNYASMFARFIESEGLTGRVYQTDCLLQCVEEQGIDILYTWVLEQAFHKIDLGDEKFHSHFKSVVGAVLLMFNPLQIRALASLLGVSDILTILHSLHPLLILGSRADSVQVFHGSFPDFLMDPERCKDKRFFINPSIHHQEILFSCLNLMKGGLKKNICNLDNYVSLDKIEDLPTHPKAKIGDALEYACRFWAKHLARVPASGHNTKEVCEAVDGFFTTCLLSWIETLTIMGHLHAAPHAINNVQQWYISVSCE